LRNTDTVQAIYEAFGRGDVSAILDRLDDAVEWETQAPVPAVPWLQLRRGKANIVGFFEAIPPLKITRFEPHTIFDGGDMVFVLIAFEATNGGKTTRFPATVTSGNSTPSAKSSGTTTLPTARR
jgi:ketosteroid isomerase-like protein